MYYFIIVILCFFLTFIQSKPIIKKSIFSTCFEIPKALCIGGTSRVISQRAIPNNLIGWWSFDDLYPIDISGNHNDIHPNVAHGPGYTGQGASAYFQPLNSVSIKENSMFNSITFSVAFWIYNLSQPNGTIRQIISRGDLISLKTPSINLNSTTNQFLIQLSYVNKINEGFLSNGTLLMNRWTHVALIAYENEVRLYLNGLVDSVVKLYEYPVYSSGNITVGGGFTGYIDDLRYYNKPLTDLSILALTIPSITGIIGNSVQLGCIDCTLSMAKEPSACPTDYNLCTINQLYLGALHVGRINGWILEGSDVWYDEVVVDDNDINKTKVGLCCKNNQIGTDVTVEL